MEKRAPKTKQRYGAKAQETVASAMRRFKRGTLKSGPRGRATVKSRTQAIAIGLSEAREKGQKVPPPRRHRASAGSPRTRRG